MKYIIILFLLVNVTHATAQTNIRIQGRLYYASGIMQQKAQVQQSSKAVVYRNYLSDIKVMLIRAGSIALDQQFVMDNKSRFCNLDKGILSRYQPTVVYTDQNGQYEFSNLSPNSRYIVLVCDRNMSVTVVSTASRRSVVYKMKDKGIVL